jgi:hypothetical protein
MLPLWQRGQLAFIPFAGTDDLTRSLAGLDAAMRMRRRSQRPPAA